MIDVQNKMFSFAEKTSEQLSPMLEKIFAAAQPDSVYSKPVVAGNYTIITASEVTSGGGFGSGAGFGPTTPTSTEESVDGVGSQPEQANSGGGGLGGGGGSAGRPVAVISIGPEGVTIKPVFDMTKIALVGITSWVAMLTMLIRMRRARKG
jgi:uncharacterized spore protein YtfJ